MARAEKMALQTELRAWTVRDSAELYNVDGWGRGFFSINDAGNVEVTPAGPGSTRIDLKRLVDDLRSRGLRLPMLIRFSDILKTRVEQLAGAFREAINDNDYKGRYLGVFPIKVNQARHVVEELIEYGRRTDLGLEAGSKPELLVALALQDNPRPSSSATGTRTGPTSRRRSWRRSSAVRSSSSSTRPTSSTPSSRRPVTWTSAPSSECAPDCPRRARASGWSRQATARSSA
jgi:hypothetical protein